MEPCYGCGAPAEIIVFIAGYTATSEGDKWDYGREVWTWNEPTCVECAVKRGWVASPEFGGPDRATLIGSAREDAR